MATLTLAERLVDAEAQYHLLLTGQSVVEVKDQNGESIRYTVANASRLLAYINDLKAQIAGKSAANAPMRFFF